MHDRRWALAMFAAVALGGYAVAAAEIRSVPAGAAARTAAGGASGASGAATTFEAVMHDAEPMGDLATLLMPFVGKCDEDKRDLDRVRCRAARGYLRRVIPEQAFWTFVDDAQALVLSEYDASIKGYHLSVAGCLACSRPVTMGRQKEARLVTLKAPDKGATSLRAAVELGRSTVAFDSLGEAKSWLGNSRGSMRMQVVFQATAETEWAFGSERGYALNLRAMRVFDRCTGDILLSQPPSAGKIDIPGVADGCPSDARRAASEAANRSGDDGDAAGPELSKNEINRAMNLIRPQVFACFEKFNVPGMAQFEFVVAGNGSLASVRLAGAFQGTPTGACVLEAAQNARFARFGRERQQFTYPFFLRR